MKPILKPADYMRIDRTVERVRELWKEHPDWRLGQLIVNVSGTDDPFYMTDEELPRKIRDWQTRRAA